MKKAITLGVTVLSALLLTACGNNSSKGQSNSEQKSSQQNRSQGFKNSSMSNAKGIIVINSVDTLTATDPSVEGAVHAVIFRGTFTNKTKSGISAEDFFNKYISAYSVSRLNDKKLDNDGLQVNSPYDSEISSAHDETNPEKTSHFAIAFQVTSLSKKYKLTALNDAQDKLGSQTFSATSLQAKSDATESSSKFNATNKNTLSRSSVSLNSVQKEKINAAFLNWAAERAEIGHMAVSDWYFDHGAAGNGDWYANTPDGRVQTQNNGNPGAEAFKIHSIGGCVFYKSKDGSTGKQDLYQGSFADNYAVAMDFDQPVSKYMLGDNGIVYELKTGNGENVSTNTGFGQTSGEGTEEYQPDQDFEISSDSAAQSELKELINQYK